MAVTINNAQITKLQIGPTLIQSQGLIGCWDAASRRSYPRTGSIWYDLCQNQNGSLVNMSDSNFLEDIHGASFVSDGTDEYITIPSSDALNVGTGSFSVIMWIKIPPFSLPTSSGGVYLIGKRGLGSLPGIPGWHIKAQGLSQSSWRIILAGIDDGSTAETIATGGSIQTDQWCMLSFIYDSSTKNLQSYSNDINSGANYFSSTIGSISNPVPLEILGTRYFNGSDTGSLVDVVEASISSVALYNIALSAADITSAYILMKDKH